MARTASSSVVDTRLDEDAQMCGFLFKLPTSGKNARWTRRYFVLLDGFLLYYSDRPKGSATFDIHVTGAIPLGGCSVDHYVGPVPAKFKDLCLLIQHPSFGDRQVVLAAEDEPTFREWYNALRDCRHVTYTNALMGAKMIEKLRGEGRHLRAQLEVLAEQLLQAEQGIVVEREQRRRAEEAARKAKEEKAVAARALLETTATLEQTTSVLMAEQSRRKSTSEASDAASNALQALKEERERTASEMEKLQKAHEALEAEVAQLREERTSMETALEQERQTVAVLRTELAGATAARAAPPPSEVGRVGAAHASAVVSQSARADSERSSSVIAPSELLTIRERARAAREAFLRAEKQRSAERSAK